MPDPRATARSASYPIRYGPELIERVLDMHAGSEELAGYPRWIREHLGGRIVAFRERLVPNILAFTSLEGLDLLDFGCGTGSTTVVLAEVARDARLTAIDVDPLGIEIAGLRLRHHGFAERVALHHIEPVARSGDLPFADASFDFVLANGVLEHVVPFSVRPQIVLEMWRLLRAGGLLYLSETPNPLWPVDRHTTGLPLLPWLPPALARRVAILAGRHRGEADFDSRGWRGMTFWDIVRPLRRNGAGYEVLNITRTGNRLLPADARPSAERDATRRGVKRRLASFVLESLAGPPLGRIGVPTVAFGPFLEHLCLRKVS